MLKHSSMCRLSDFANGRDNNFNLIRLIAATMVLYSHSFALAAGLGIEPWVHLGITPGSVAVDVFFITSGFLVTASLLARKEIFTFVMARVLRIYPALLVVVALTIFVLGLNFTTDSAHDYFSNQETLSYALRNTTIIAGCCGHLPHVFDDNPVRSAINGSLWTMPWEVRMYFLLVAIGLIAKLTQWRDGVWKGLIVLALAVFTATFFINHYAAISFMKDDRALRLGMMFFVGATYFAFKEKIYIGRATGYASAALVALAIIGGEQVFLPIYTLLIGYIALHLAYLPSGKIRSFNKFGDYSYGVYIYAFPIQQSIVALSPKSTGITLFFTALPFVFLFSILSWHVIEKRSLRLKSKQVPFKRTTQSV